MSGNQCKVNVSRGDPDRTMDALSHCCRKDLNTEVFRGIEWWTYSDNNDNRNKIGYIAISHNLLLKWRTDTKHSIAANLLSLDGDLELEPKWRESTCIHMHSRAHATDR